MANRRKAIECLVKAEHLPEAIVPALMELTSRPGARTTHANGTHLDATISKEGGTIVVHRNVTINFVDSPIRGMGYSANAEEWQITYEGRVITLTLFDICYNWTITSNQPVAPSPPAEGHCPVIRAFTHYGDQVMQHIRLTPNGRVEASGACPFMFKRPGDTHWYELPTECPHGPCDFRLTIDSSGGLLPGPSGGVNVLHAPGGYEFQVPWEWVNNKEVIFALCLTVESGEHSCAKDIRTADYTDGVAIVGYGDPGEVPLGWKGHERIWCLPKTVNGHCEFCPK